MYVRKNELEKKGSGKNIISFVSCDWRGKAFLFVPPPPAVLKSASS